MFDYSGFVPGVLAGLLAAPAYATSCSLENLGYPRWLVRLVIVPATISTAVWLGIPVTQNYFLYVVLMLGLMGVWDIVFSRQPQPEHQPTPEEQVIIHALDAELGLVSTDDVLPKPTPRTVYTGPR